jgi:translation initiation factor IF-1
MPGEDTFRVEGVIVAVLSERTFRVELANGHRLLGFLTRRSRETVGSLNEGDRVTVQLTPFDLSEGRIVGRAANERP